jgi:hypothetical protein
MVLACDRTGARVALAGDRTNAATPSPPRCGISFPFRAALFDLNVESYNHSQNNTIVIPKTISWKSAL